MKSKPATQVLGQLFYFAGLEILFNVGYCRADDDMQVRQKSETLLGLMLLQLLLLLKAEEPLATKAATVNLVYLSSPSFFHMCTYKFTILSAILIYRVYMHTFAFRPARYAKVSFSLVGIIFFDEFINIIHLIRHFEPMTLFLSTRVLLPLDYKTGL